jgi:hypothetical protein
LYCTVCFIVYGTVIGNYGFNSVYEDYDSMIYTMSDNPNPQDIIISKLLLSQQSKILSAIEYKPKVRNFAVMATTQNFKM